MKVKAKRRSKRHGAIRYERTGLRFTSASIGFDLFWFWRVQLLDWKRSSS